MRLIHYNESKKVLIAEIDKDKPFTITLLPHQWSMVHAALEFAAGKSHEQATEFRELCNLLEDQCPLLPRKIPMTKLSKRILGEIEEQFGYNNIRIGIKYDKDSDSISYVYEGNEFICLLVLITIIYHKDEKDKDSYTEENIIERVINIVSRIRTEDVLIDDEEDIKRMVSFIDRGRGTIIETIILDEQRLKLLEILKKAVIVGIYKQGDCMV